ncbi:MAG TPA: response regulator [Bacteroidia bacterium]|jgi:two-component system response regulator|nr:response regulator [Bacteroidia bacterium]
MKNDEVEILLVEDNPDDAEMTIRALRKKNLSNNIIHLNDGAVALDFIFGTGQYEGRDISKKPKLIMLDLKMPKVSGIEVLEKLKSKDSTKTIPVVVLTSSKEDPDIQKCYKLGANSYIVKPVDFDAFQNTIAELGLYWLLLNQPII